MKHIFLPLAILLSGCSTANIVNNEQNNSLEIKTQDMSIIKSSGSLVYESRVNLSNINIYQRVYKIQNGALITYEDINVASGYIFNKGINPIVQDVFKPLYTYEFIYSKGNLFFYTLTPKDKSKNKEYLIVENLNKRALKFVYGLDKSGFEKIIDALKNDLTLQIPKQSKKNAPAQDLKSYIKSNWNYKNIVLDNLVSKVGNGPRVLK
jgi:hypothetical protein